MNLIRKRFSTRNLFSSGNFVIHSNMILPENDILSFKLSEYRIEANKLVHDGSNQDHFVIALLRKGLHEFAKLPLSHPLYLPNYLIQNHEGEVMDDIFLKCFQTSRSAVFGDFENNFSGYGLYGSGNITESILIRSAAIVCGSILPNYIAIYCDTSIFKNALFFPSVILKEALQKCEIKVQCESDIDELIVLAYSNKLGLGLFLDEVNYVYNEVVWSQLHSFISSFCATSIFLADRSSLLPAMVMAMNKQIKECFGVEKAFPSLNGSKIKLIALDSVLTPKRKILSF